MNVLLVENINTNRGAAMSMKSVIKLLHEKYKVEFTVLQHKENSLTEYYKGIGVKSIVTGHDTHIETTKLYGQDPLKKIYYLMKRLRWALMNDKKAYEIIQTNLQIDDFDIVYTNLNRYAIGHIINKRHGIPHVVHLREFGDLDFRTISAIPKFQKILDKYVTKYIAISQAVKDHYTLFGIDSEKIDVIYNGVKVPEVIRESEILLNDKVRIVMVGSIEPTKSQADVIKAIEILPNKYKQRVVIDFYGNGEERYIKELQIAAEKGDVQLNIRGQVNNIPEVLLDYDIGITASRAEAFGRATIEYMMAGILTIASDTGANPEIVKDQFGYLYEYGNSESLAKKIIIAIENPAKSREIATKAYEYAINKYTDIKNADAIYKLFAKVVVENE